MWLGRLILLGASAATLPAAAQTTDIPREQVTVHGDSSCSVVQPDGSRALSVACLNAQFTDSVAVPQAPTLQAVNAAGRGNPEALGTFSYTATQIRMGANFGKSVKPERPFAQSCCANPLLPAPATRRQAR